MLGLKPEPLLPWDGVLLVVDRLLEDPFDFSTELGIYRLIFDMQLAQCCMPIPRTQKGKPTMASQPWPASADLNDREQILDTHYMVAGIPSTVAIKRSEQQYCTSAPI